MIKNNKGLILSIAVCLLPFVISAVYYDQLPEQIAIHFSAGNVPDRYASKLFASFGLPAIMLAVHLYTRFRLESDPRKEGYSAVMKLLSGWLVPVLSVVMQVSLISFALGGSFDMNFYISLLVGFLFILMGNYLPKCRRNYTMGIKLPWTLSSDDNWNRTHRISGYLYILGGLILLVNAFLNIPAAILCVIGVLVVSPVVYSYALFRKQPKDR